MLGSDNWLRTGLTCSDLAPAQYVPPPKPDRSAESTIEVDPPEPFNVHGILKKFVGLRLHIADLAMPLSRIKAGLIGSGEGLGRIENRLSGS